MGAFVKGDLYRAGTITAAKIQQVRAKLLQILGTWGGLLSARPRGGDNGTMAPAQRARPTGIWPHGRGTPCDRATVNAARRLASRE